MDLAELIAEYVTAKAALDKAKSSCDSSWGYFLHGEADNVERLSKQIDAKVIELVAEGKV